MNVGIASLIVTTSSAGSSTARIARRRREEVARRKKVSGGDQEYWVTDKDIRQVGTVLQQKLNLTAVYYENKVGFTIPLDTIDRIMMGLILGVVFGGITWIFSWMISDIFEIKFMMYVPAIFVFATTMIYNYLKAEIPVEYLRVWNDRHKTHIEIDVLDDKGYRKFNKSFLAQLKEELNADEGYV